MNGPKGYCATCNNTGAVECYCGGDLCVCGEEEIECPECGGVPDDGGFGDDDDEAEYPFLPWGNR